MKKERKTNKKKGMPQELKDFCEANKQIKANLRALEDKVPGVKKYTPQTITNYFTLERVDFKASFIKDFQKELSKFSQYQDLTFDGLANLLM